MKNQAKNTKKILLAVCGLVLVIGAMLFVYQLTKGKTSAGEKTITVQVIHKDESLHSFEYTTDREYLGEVLIDEKLVEGETGDYGLFITTVDGETVDAANQEWWCITKGGEMLNTSADQTPIADGDTYELTLTIGY